MCDDELPVFRAVLVVDRVITEFEPRAGDEVADGACAAEGLAGEVLGLLAQFGIARHLVGGAAVVAGLGVVVFEAIGERGQRLAGIPRIDVGVVFPHVGGDSLVVVARERTPAGLDLAFGGPGVDGVVGFDAVGAVEAERIRCIARMACTGDGPGARAGTCAGIVLCILGRTTPGEVVVAVEEDQGVLREDVRGVLRFVADGTPSAFFASRRALERALGIGAVAVAGADAFFGEQAFDEGEVGLAVLETVGADGVVLTQEVPVLEDAGEGGVGGEVFVEDAGNDLRNAFVLEDAAVAAVREGGERRFDGEDVSGEAAVGAVLGGVGDEAGEETGTAIGKQQTNLDGLAQQTLEFEVGVGGEAIEGVAVVRR